MDVKRSEQSRLQREKEGSPLGRLGAWLGTEMGGVAAKEGGEARCDGAGGRRLSRETIAAQMLRRLGGLLLGACLADGGGLPYGARPMGIALLCALGVNGAVGDLIAVGIGVLARAWIEGDGALAWVAVALTLIRAIGLRMGVLREVRRGGEKPSDVPFRDIVEDEPLVAMLPVQMVLGCGGAVVMGVLHLMAGGYQFEDLYGLLVSLACQPLLIAGYRYAFEDSAAGSVKCEIGQMLLALSVLLALAPIRIGVVRVALILAMLLTLYISRTGGALRAGVMGCLAGMLLGGRSAVFGMSGLVAGLLWEKGVTLACAGGMSAALACEMWSMGVTVGTPISELILGSAAAIPLLQMPNIPRIFRYTPSLAVPRPILTRGSQAILAKEAQEKRLTALTESMQSLSEVFYRLSDRMRKPGAGQVRELCEGCFKESCVKCPLTALCYVREQTSTADAISAMTLAICREGMLSVADVPDYLRKRCSHMEQIVNRINDAHIDMLEKAARSDKLEVLALDYQAMAGLLSHASRIHAAETEPDPILTKRLTRVASDLGMDAQCLSVVGKRRLRVVAGGVTPGKLHLSAGEIREAFGGALGVHLTDPRFDYENDYVTMTLNTARRFRIETARAGMEKAREKISGDSIALFENREDYAYALISDGMGSGADAAMTSKMTAVFLRTLLASGNPKGVAIEMLNNFIRSKNLECFATVDLFEVDLISGTGCFIKSGAAPSFVLREGKLFKIASSTLPVGITRQVKCEEIRFDLQHGDVVVLVSDGVSGEGESDPVKGLGDCLFLTELLTYGWKEGMGLQEMCEAILMKAREIGGGGDDMTVVMVRVEDVNEMKKNQADFVTNEEETG